METKTQAETKTSESEGMTKELNSKMEDLHVMLVDKASEIEELHNIALEQEKKFEEEVASLKSKVEELTSSLAAESKAKEEAVSELRKIREEALLQERLRILRDKNLLRSAEESQVKQGSKVKAMTDVEFDAYVEDLLDVRAQALTSIPAAPVQNEVVNKIADAIVDESASEGTRENVKKVLKALNVGPAPLAAEAKTQEVVAPVEKKELASVKPVMLDVKALAAGFTNILNIEE